jgi:hypothetical protein
VMMFAMSPKSGPGWALWAAMLGAVLVPWVLERAGALSPTMYVTDTHLVLLGNVDRLDGDVVTVGLAVYTALILAMAVAITRSISNNRRSTQRVLQIQAWQLRQLVPQGVEG